MVRRQDAITAPAQQAGWSEVVREQRPAGHRVSRLWDSTVGRTLLPKGTGYITLSRGKLLAEKEVEAMRASGTIRRASPNPTSLTTTKRGALRILAWATSAYIQPPPNVNCVLALLSALVGMSLASMGAARDTLVRINPLLVTYSQVNTMLIRLERKHAPVGALRLVRRRNIVSPLHLLQQRTGVFMFAGYAVKGDIPFRHAVGLNADCDLFFANPWVIAITEEDRAHPLVFFLRLEADFGIRVPWIIASRQLVVDPTGAGMGALPFAAVAAVSGGESATTHRGKRARRGKTHRGKRAKVLRAA